MSERNSLERKPPVIFGAAGDIGRSALQQALTEGIKPAGAVLTQRRLSSKATRQETARQIATNYVPGGEGRLLSRVELLKEPEPVLRVGDLEIPVFTPRSQHEILQEGHPVIDATGQHKTREKLEPILGAGAEFIVITSPIHEDEGIKAVVYGVNSDREAFEKAYDDRLLSTSSCTTTALSSFLSPVLEAGINPACVTVDVSHARTNSNSASDINNNIKLSSSGAIKEVPKILGEKADDLIFNLECTRADANCGSVASVTLFFGLDQPWRNPLNLKHKLKQALSRSESVVVFDEDIKNTKDVVGRYESAFVNIRDLSVTEARGRGIVIATGIYVFYDNVNGYTRSVMDSFKAMGGVMLGEAAEDQAEEIAA